MLDGRLRTAEHGDEAQIFWRDIVVDFRFEFARMRHEYAAQVDAAKAVTIDQYQIVFERLALDDGFESAVDQWLDVTMRLVVVQISLQ